MVVPVGGTQYEARMFLLCSSCLHALAGGYSLVDANNAAAARHLVEIQGRVDRKTKILMVLPALL